MKLLMVTNYFESHRGGLELIAGRLVRELARLGVRELARLGEDVRWLASDVTPPPQDPELGQRTVAVRVLNLTERRFGIPFPLPSPRAIARLRREVYGCDAVLLQDSLYPLSVAAFLFARWAGRPVVIAQHVGLVPYRNPLFRLVMALLNRAVARPMLARAERVAFFSEITARYFATVERRVPAALLFTGVDTDLFRPAAAGEKAGLRRRLALDPGRPVALFVGRFVEKKGLPLLERMARRRPDWQWAFAGWGPLDPALWKLPNVFVFRDLAGAGLVPLYQASDVFVLPSKGEGFPLVIQEALACGLPVVCSAATAAADAAVAPLLFPVALDEAQPEATAAAFCAEIDRRLASPATAEAAAERFGFVARRYSWPACADEYLALIEAAAASVRRRPARTTAEIFRSIVASAHKLTETPRK